MRPSLTSLPRSTWHPPGLSRSRGEWLGCRNLFFVLLANMSSPDILSIPSVFQIIYSGTTRGGGTSEPLEHLRGDTPSSQIGTVLSTQSLSLIAPGRFFVWLFKLWPQLQFQVCGICVSFLSRQ